MKTTVYQIAQTPVLIKAAANEPQTIYIDPTAQDLYIGGSNVTDANGVALTKSVITPIFINSYQTLYCIAKTGKVPIIILEESP
jgi:hypothetical protein